MEESSGTASVDDNTTHTTEEEEDRRIIKLRTIGESNEVHNRIIEFRTTCVTTTSNTVIEPTEEESSIQTITYITCIEVEEEEE